VLRTIHKQASFPADNIVGIISVEDQETFATIKDHITGIYAASATQLEKLAA